MRTTSAVLLATILMSACGGEGPPGPAGPAGPQGPTGATGAPGMSLSRIAVCSSAIVRVGAYDIALHLERYEFTDGSVMVYCEVDNGAASLGRTVLFRANQAGANVSGCSVVHDVDTSFSGGFWRFRLLSNATSGAGTYVDSSSASNGAVIPYTCQTF